jgi:hypothetical protein
LHVWGRPRVIIFKKEVLFHTFNLERIFFNWTSFFVTSFPLTSLPAAHLSQIMMAYRSSKQSSTDQTPHMLPPPSPPPPQYSQSNDEEPSRFFLTIVVVQNVPLLFVIRFTASDYSLGIFWSLYCVLIKPLTCYHHHRRHHRNTHRVMMKNPIIFWKPIIRFCFGNLYTVMYFM